MTAQEWKKWWGSFDEWPESGSIAADDFYITAIGNADAIIRAQQERIERLELAVYRACEELSLRKCSPDCPNNKKCAVITMVSRGACRDHWRKWLMEGE